MYGKNESSLDVEVKIGNAYRLAANLGKSGTCIDSMLRSLISFIGMPLP